MGLFRLPMSTKITIEVEREMIPALAECFRREQQKYWDAMTDPVNKDMSAKLRNTWMDHYIWFKTKSRELYNYG